MAVLLSLDTSTKFGAIAVAEWQPGVNATGSMRVIGELSVGVDSSQQSESLLLGIDQLLKHARLTVADLDVIACAVGPGSFTGVRVGLMTAKTLGFVANKPIARFSSLALLARPAALALESGAALSRSAVDVVVVRPAAAGEWYVFVGDAKKISSCVAKAQGDFAGAWTTGVREELMTPDALGAFLKKRKNNKRVLISSQFGREDWNSKQLDGLKKFLGPKSFLDVDPTFFALPQPRWCARLGIEAFEAGLALIAKQVLPRYLREADATRKLKRGELNVHRRVMED